MSQGMGQYTNPAIFPSMLSLTLSAKLTSTSPTSIALKASSSPVPAIIRNLRELALAVTLAAIFEEHYSPRGYSENLKEFNMSRSLCLIAARGDEEDLKAALADEVDVNMTGSVSMIALCWICMLYLAFPPTFSERRNGSYKGCWQRTPRMCVNSIGSWCPSRQGR